MPPTISSEKLEKILEVNSKAIEINTIVNVQYEKIIEHLEKTQNNSFSRNKEIDVAIGGLKEQHSSIINSNKELVKASEGLMSYIEEVKEIVNRIDRTLFRISVILIGSSAIVTTIVQIVAKFVFKL